jgi:hypothetical protein
MRADRMKMRASLARIHADARHMPLTQLSLETAAFIAELERVAISLPGMTDIGKRDELTKVCEAGFELSGKLDDGTPGACEFEDAITGLGMMQVSESELLEAIVGVAQSALALLTARDGRADGAR